MTVFSLSRRDRRREGHALPIVLGAIAALGGMAMTAYLLWPTWTTGLTGDPERLPVSVGGTLFNVPVSSIRMKIQRHSGPQERVDLDFDYPSLRPPEPQRHVHASEVVEEMTQPIDRIFLSIAAHHDVMSPETRVRSIYPRYLEQASTAGPDGLTGRAFRADSPYVGEDLYTASAPSFAARCTRDAATPGMCLSERRIDKADLTYRFPRSWLAQWQDVASATDRLAQQLRGGR